MALSDLKSGFATHRNAELASIPPTCFYKTGALNLVLHTQTLTIAHALYGFI